jgi:hemerythrin-like domain-containing protein
MIGFRNTSFVVFKNQLASLTRYLCPALKEHLFHEDRVLFPLAVEMIEDPNLWTKLKTVCDEIDYCGIHL